MRIHLYFMMVAGLLFPLPAEEKASTAVELLYRDGRVTSALLTGWNAEGPRWEGDGDREGLMAVRFPPKESSVHIRGVGTLEDWTLHAGMEAVEEPGQGLLLRYGEESSKTVLRRLKVLPDRFVCRLRLRRIQGRQMQVDFFAPESGYLVPGMLGVAFHRGRVMVHHYGARQEVLRSFIHKAPEWSDGVVELEVMGDRSQGLMALKINQGTPVVWTVMKADFPPAGAHILRIRPMEKTGELLIESLMLEERAGFVTEAIAGPFPVWDFRNGDRFKGQGSGDDADSLRMDTGNGVPIPVPLSVLETVWLAPPAAPTSPQEP